MSNLELCVFIFHFIADPIRMDGEVKSHLTRSVMGVPPFCSQLAGFVLNIKIHPSQPVTALNLNIIRVLQEREVSCFR